MTISDELTRIQNAKSALKTSIENKGVTVSDSTLLSGYSALVDQIQTGGGGGNEDLKNLIERDITSITIPNGTTKIGNNAFYDCTSLTSVTIPNSVTSIGSNAFNNCRSLPKENNVYYSSDYKYAVLAESYQSSYQIKDGTRVLANYLFSNANITSITIPDSVISIPFGIFYNRTTLTSVTIGSGVTSISDNAFYNCSKLTSITIPDSVTSIGNTAFQGCRGLISVTIGNSVTSIGNFAFNGCTGLTSITIPDSVTSIGSNAFYQCTSLTSVTVQATTPPTLVHSNAFSNTNTNLIIYVPAESLEAYKTATNWSSLSSRLQAIA